MMTCRTPFSRMPGLTSGWPMAPSRMASNERSSSGARRTALRRGAGWTRPWIEASDVVERIDQFLRGEEPEEAEVVDALDPRG